LAPNIRVGVAGILKTKPTNKEDTPES
jgi:hypothetical protein